MSPFGIIEIGYSFYSAEAQVTKSLSLGEQYSTENEIPQEYRNSSPAVYDDSSYSIGVGAGLNYQLSKSIGLNIRYIFKYYDSKVNANQILFGMIF